MLGNGDTQSYSRPLSFLAFWWTGQAGRRLWQGGLGDAGMAAGGLVGMLVVDGKGGKWIESYRV